MPLARRPLIALAAAVAAGCGSGGSTGAAAPPTVDPAAAPPGTASARAPRLDAWPLFGLRPSRENATTRPTGVTASSVRRLTRHAVAIPGTVDSSPILVGGRIVVTTTYGRTLALDPRTRRVLWTFTPDEYPRVAGNAQITNASPAGDAAAGVVYAASPGGLVHKLSLADGREAAGWPVRVTRDPTHEKLTSSLNLSRGRVLVTTGGYIGDAPPYQGHVVALDAASGRIRGVFNSLCSDRRAIITPSTCRSSDSAIWARSGAVVLPGSGDLLVATGNGPFDGRTDWGDSVLRLSPDATRLKQNWTPPAEAQMNATDTDLGSTAPALLGHGLALQGGKDAKLHLLRIADLNGARGGAGPRKGGELQTLRAPGGDRVFTAPAVARAGGRTTVFVATGSGTAAYRLRGRRLRVLWANGHAGTSPVLAGGLLYIFDPDGGGLRVYRPDGRVVATLPAGSGHWGSPIVAAGVVVAPEGSANDHRTSGVLDIYS